MTYTELVTEVTELLGLTSTTDLARVGRAINRKYKEISSSLGIKHTSRRTTVQATMTPGVSTLQFTSCEKLVNIFNRSSTPYVQLEDVTKDELQAQMPFNASDTPTQYAIQQIASDSVTVLLNCTPQTALTLYADVYSTAATLSGTDEPVFSESYHDILISAVLIDEYLKLEKPSLSAVAERHVEKRMGELRHWIAVSTTKKDYQGKTGAAGATAFGGGGSGSGGSVDGASSWTQTGLITFDRDPLAPFAVDPSSAVVTNLDADKLDGLDSTAFALIAHKTRHQDGGADEISVTGLSGLLADSQTPLAHSAALLTSGTVPDARFPATLPAVSGVNLTALNASNLASGTVADARMSGATFKAGDGAVGTPSLTFANEPDCGLYKEGTNAIAIATAGVKALGFDSTQFIDSPTQPRCRAYKSSAVQSINDSTFTAVTLDAESYDVGVMHDNVTANTHVTVPTGGDGLYLITAQASFAANATGVRALELKKSGTAITDTQIVAANVVQYVPLQDIQVLVAGDYIEMFAFQSSGGNLNVVNGATATFLTLVKLW